MLGEVKQIKQMIHDSIRDIHTCIPAEIKSFDSSKCVAKVQPSGKFKKANGEYLDYPELSNVPVYILQSADQKATVAFPIKDGDGCLLLFSEQQLDTFRDNQQPKSDLRHDISNAIALVGLVSSANSVVKNACDDDAIIIDRKDTRISVKDKEITVLVDKNSKDTEISATNSKVSVKRGSTSLEIEDGKITINAAEVEIKGKLTVEQTVSGSDFISSTSSYNSHIHLCTAPSTPSTLPFPEGTPLEEMLAALEG